MYPSSHRYPSARLGAFFKEYGEIPRKVGQKQIIETLINEEAWLFAKYQERKKRLDATDRNGQSEFFVLFFYSCLRQGFYA